MYMGIVNPKKLAVISWQFAMKKTRKGNNLFVSSYFFRCISGCFDGAGLYNLLIFFLCQSQSQLQTVLSSIILTFTLE